MQENCHEVTTNSIFTMIFCTVSVDIVQNVPGTKCSWYLVDTGYQILYLFIIRFVHKVVLVRLRQGRAAWFGST